MSVTTTPAASRPRSVHIGTAIALAVFAAVFVAGETWAKWWPYAHKVVALMGDHAYPGKSVLQVAGPAGAAPSWSHTWAFAVAYGKSVWVALVAALAIGAGVEALLPRKTVARFMGRGGLRASAGGAVAALPCLMCTCCSAPVTASLRRSGASSTSSLAYWLGNPVLNPAVLVFLALVLPWQYAVTRIGVGAALVLLAPPVVARLSHRPAGAEAPSPLPAEQGVPGAGRRSAPVAYLRALLRLALLLVPEYFVGVLAAGALRGWIFPLGHNTVGWGVVAVVIAAVAGTLLVIPTGAEIPVITALTAAGFGAGVTGAVLIALPAVSVPSMLMVGRVMGVRTVLATAGAVVVAALAGAGMLSALA